MGTVSCRSCNGAGRKWVDFRKGGGKFFDCKACNGSGINYKLWSTRCQRCRTEIIYKAYTEEPRFCKMCKNIELEKVCSQFGCTNRIKYKVGWTNVSDYCGPCRKKREQGWSASTCPGTGLMGCGKLIWSPPGKRFTLCRDCNQRKRAEEEAKWKVKRCKSCNGEIRYNVDWSNVPEYCKSCNQWQHKTCEASGCHNQVRYKKYWDNPPKYCSDCKKKVLKPKNITSGDLFRSGLIPQGWRAEARDIDIQQGHISIFFQGKGTNGAAYRVSWDGFGEPHWTDQGLPVNHPDRHKDPRT